MLTEENQQVPDGTQLNDAPVADTVQAVREWGDSWKKTASEYKQTADFVSEKFGDLTSAELAHSIYSSFVGEEFDPVSFARTLEQMSPERAGKLVENLALDRAEKVVPEKIQELFGGPVTPEEVKLFKTWKESGYSLGEGDDLPEALKVDKDGNPRSEEELEFLRSLKNQVKELSQGRKSDEMLAQEQAEYERQVQIQESINEYGLSRLKILDNEFEAMGLMPTANDSSEDASKKEYLRQFLVHGVSGVFLADPELSRDYRSAIEHLSKGEALLARRYEARIEKALVGILRGGFLEDLRSTLMPEKKAETRPEISNAGQSADIGTKIPGSREEWIKSLLERGVIKP